MAAHFSVTSALGQRAWIGIVPSKVAHGSSAEVELKVPEHDGSWDVRLHDSATSDGNEIASVTFVVDERWAGLPIRESVGTHRVRFGRQSR